MFSSSSNTVVVAVVAFVAVVAVAAEQLPPFLKNATPAQVEQFKGLITNHGHLNEAQLDAEVQAWAKQQGAPLVNDFAEFQQFIKNSEAKAEAAHQAAIAKWSPEARQADAQLTALSRDTELPVKVKGEKIHALLESLPANIRQELIGQQ